MNVSSSLKHLCAAMAFGLLSLPALAEDKPKAAEPAEPAKAESGAKKKQPLEKGMDAEAVIAAIGKPVEVKPIESEDNSVHAENWIYRRKLKTTTTQVADSQSTQPAYTGLSPTGVQTIVDVPVATYRNKQITTYQVTALLMVNGKLELARQWTEEDASYMN